MYIYTPWRHLVSAKFRGEEYYSKWHCSAPPAGLSSWEERVKWHTGLHLMFFDAGRVEPRRTQSLYFELQLHGSWGLHNCSGVPLKLHTLKTLCGCSKSCIPLPPPLMCAVPSEEITLPQMFITTAHLCNMWQTDACTHKYATGQDNSCDSSSTNNKTEPFKSLVKSCLRTKDEANDLQQTS